MNWKAVRYWPLCFALDFLGAWALQAQHAAWYWYVALGIGVAYVVGDITRRN